jgi:hypothetical protein
LGQDKVEKMVEIWQKMYGQISMRLLYSTSDKKGGIRWENGVLVGKSFWWESSPIYPDGGGGGRSQAQRPPSGDGQRQRRQTRSEGDCC